MKKLHLFKLFLVTLVLSLPFAFFGQSVLYVTSLGDNGPGTLRQQVINAFPGDTIKFQVTGTIFLSTGWIDFAKNLVIEGPGMNDLIIRPSSPDRVLRFNGNFSLSKLTIKDGFSSNSSWAGGITGSGGIIKLDNVKFDNCKKQVSGAASLGGAVAIASDSIYITNSIFLNNRATSSNKDGGGGAVSCGGLKIFVNNCTFEGNAASAGCDYSNGVLNSRGYGGAIYINGYSSTNTILVDSCVFNNNHITSYCTVNAGSSIGRGYAYGGAIHLAGIRNTHTIKIRNSTFTSNSATGSGALTYNYSYGGAISNDESTSLTTSMIQLENLIINNNTANGTGEGIIFIKGGGLKMSNCEIVDNDAKAGVVNVLANQPVRITFCNFSDNNGIGIYSNVYSPSNQLFSNCLFEGNRDSAIKLANVTGTTNIVNSTFTGNSSNGGSSIYLSSNNGPINILNCTMMDEQVLTAGKPHSLYVYNSSNVAIKNTIISHSTFSSNPLAAYSGSTILTGGGNIIRDGSLATFLVNATDMNNTNPLLGTFDNHGGPTYTYSLQPTSPAIDLGGADTLSIDQRGFYRTNAIDAGAFEFNGVNPYEPVVLTMSDDTVTICSNGTEQIWVSANDIPNDPVQFQWMLNGVDIPGATDSFYQVGNLTPGVYYYSCELSNNSGSTISDTITVEVFAGPGVLANGSASICSGESVTVSASGATSYTWNNGLGAGASHVVSPSVTTTYQVTGTDGNGCTGTDQVTITVNSNPTIIASNDASICNGGSVTISASGATSYLWNNGLGAGASHIVSPSVTTTYQVTGTDGNGCTGTDQVTIAVNSNPTISAGNDQSICVGESATISASGAISYTWNNGLGAGASHVVSPSVTTTYQVTGTDNNGCTNTDQVTVSVTTAPDNNVTFSSDQLTITATTAGVDYVWIDCNNSFQVIPNETNQSFTPSQNGSYAVIVSNQGCADTSLCVVIDHVSINSLQENQLIAVYPNPFDTEFIISFKTTGSYFIELLNTLGQTIKAIRTEGQSTVVSADDLPSGVYYIRVVDTSWRYKIIKN